MDFRNKPSDGLKCVFIIFSPYIIRKIEHIFDLIQNKTLNATNWSYIVSPPNFGRPKMHGLSMTKYMLLAAASTVVADDVATAAVATAAVITEVMAAAAVVAGGGAAVVCVGCCCCRALL